MRALLMDRDTDLLAFCLVYGLEDESTKHAILHCLRVRLI